MSQQNAFEYYRGRERRERIIANEVVDPAIAAIHLELADRYSALTFEGERRPMPIA